MKNVFILNGSGAYNEMFKLMGYSVTEDLSSAELVCFTGGEDVSPSFYGHERHPTTYSNINRDQYEADVFHVCKRNGIPMVGICRGAQFLNVMSGGEMYQDVRGHTQDHLITDLETGESVWVSSTHHQMMKPSSEAVLVASGGIRGERTWFENGIFKRDVSNEDIEVVYYPESNALCFQPHPEFGGLKYTNMHTYFSDLLKRYCVYNYMEDSADLVGCGC